MSGIAPRVSPRLLEPDNAQVARNARLESGDLEAWAGLADVQAVSAQAQSIFLFEDQYWLQWNTPVDAVRAPLADDPNARVYFTGAGAPKFTDAVHGIAGPGPYPVDSYAIGIPAPPSGLSASVSGPVTDDNPALVETRAYVYTYVSQYDEEGPPSAASNLVDWAPGQQVSLTGFSAPSGDFVIQQVRIYRTSSSGASTQYQFVAQVSVTTTTYQDTAETLGEILATDGWIAPPADMHSLVTLPNGSLAGASGLDICISEPYQPHAWPLAYRHAADDPVVTLGVIGNSLVVLTGRRPYVITGASPQSMTMTEAGPADFACVSARGAASVPGLGVVYPAANGLVGITYEGARYLSNALMTREQWRAYDPETMIGLAHRGRWFGFHSGGCLVYDPAGGLYELSLTIAGGYRDPATDTLYVIEGGQIRQWGGATTAYAPYQWRSKLYELPYAASFSAARVRAESYADIALTLYAEGVPVATVAPTSAGAFRLPAMQRAKRWELELSGTDRLHTYAVAETMDEL